MAWKNDQMSPTETEKIRELTQSVLDIDGDFVEFGCYKGDTSMLLAEVMRDALNPKILWLYDSFAGLPERTREDDVQKDAVSQAEFEENSRFQRGELQVQQREVKERFLRAGYAVPRIKRAWFNELQVVDLPTGISFALIDGDLYESTRDALHAVMPRVAAGGVVAVHDYANPALPGVKRAVDEWLAACDAKPETEIFETIMIIRL